MAKRKGKMHLLGLGMDDDGHRRITKSEQYTLLGGSKETHEMLQETAAKIEEKAKKRGKQIEELDARDCRDIMEELDG